MKYQDTVLLPKTEFPMRANLPQREPLIQERWLKEDFYRQLRERRRGQPKYILHDGPPYANGHIHLGTAVNKVLKDIVIRSRTMSGYDCPYVPGWDVHGLPIEHALVRQLGVDRHALSPVEFRQKCKEFALHWLNIQREEFKRLGVWGEWDDPYLTLKPEYEAKQVEIFGAMVNKGYIYRGLKPVYWCAECESSLAEAEVEYHDHTSHAIYVKFPVANGQGKIPTDEPAYVLIWTTTPWTLPANEAIALHPQLTYALVDTEAGRILMAEERIAAVAEETGLKKVEVLQRWSGQELEGVLCRHPFRDKTSLVILADHVTLEQGSGCVHTAPGHGLEDYAVGVEYGLPVFAPVDNQGRFTEEAGKYAGMKLDDANHVIISDLKAVGLLLHHAKVEHQYPHCWRCKNPIIFRATEQWFVSIEDFREQALDAIEQVQWIPKWGIDRISNMVRERSDWCISRQRLWGVPIPIFYCKQCGEPVVNEETIKRVADLFRREGSDGWFIHTAEEILPPDTSCPACGHREFVKEKDIMDVWFDSGSSHMAVLEQREGLRWPADLYLEGSDQHRGWFQSSLLTSVAVRGTAPYKAVLTHGFIVDAEGRKMSKSLGNTIAPEEIINRYGADVLRLWAASADYRGDIRVSPKILEQMSDVYRRIRNTIRFMLGNLADFRPAENKVPREDLPEMDRYILAQFYRLVERVIKAYDDYEFHVVYHGVHNFCTVDLSSFYLDVVKDRLYCDAPDSLSRRAAQTVIAEILVGLIRLVAPILVHTAEEAWEHLPDELKDGPSVHFSTWPAVEKDILDARDEEKWAEFMAIRREVAKALEQARMEKAIGSSNDAGVTLYPDAELHHVLSQFDTADLEALFIVSEVEVADPQAAAPEGVWTGYDGRLKVLVRAPKGEKCARCWRYSSFVGTAVDHPSLCERCYEVVTQHVTANS
ncbi:MAG TPA: isoleucine--tRNA ligase [Firmicutes bacterium]|nr:isoleucine--tRNA ligase [Bacillota bacterium]